MMGFAKSFVRKVTVLVCALAAYIAAGDDYVKDVSPSAAARAYFAAVPTNLASRTVSRRNPAAKGEDEAYFTEDGAISIPPGAMILFRNAGKCMDPHLPAPCPGEPMQFVGTEKLIPRQLQETYDMLLKRSADGDPAVRANNLQHLVWAIRTAGTEDPIANNLSDAQRDLLDECSGRRGGFTRYHEREKNRNARRSRRGRAARDANRISVGSLSYDASELSGTNGVRRIQSHIETLTEMGEKSTMKSSSDLRYGEIEEELYSDIVCEGGLSFAARILNASEQRREFKASEFAAQVGNGVVAGTQRQRVTMTPPDEFVVVMGAAQKGVEIDREMSVVEVEGGTYSRSRAQTGRRSRTKSASEHTETTSENERTKRTRKSETTPTEEITPVPPVPPVTPVPPVVVHDAVTNEVIRVVPEQVSVRVVSLLYDADSRTGVLTVEIVSGSFKDATAYIRRHFDNLVRKQSTPAESVKIPKDSALEIDTISINAQSQCEVKFEAK